MFDENRFYIVLEIQATTDNTSVLHNVYADRETAENKYHTILAFASTSSVPKHSAVMLNERGVWIKGETYTHPITESDEVEE